MPVSKSKFGVKIIISSTKDCIIKTIRALKTDVGIKKADIFRNNTLDKGRLCEKISVNSKTVIKTLCCERLENSRSDFFTVYNGY